MQNFSLIHLFLNLSSKEMCLLLGLTFPSRTHVKLSPNYEMCEVRCVGQVRRKPGWGHTFVSDVPLVGYESLGHAASRSATETVVGSL